MRCDRLSSQARSESCSAVHVRHQTSHCGMDYHIYTAWKRIGHCLRSDIRGWAQLLVRRSCMTHIFRTKEVSWVAPILIPMDRSGLCPRYQAFRQRNYPISLHTGIRPLVCLWHLRPHLDRPTCFWSIPNMSSAWKGMRAGSSLKTITGWLSCLGGLSGLSKYLVSQMLAQVTTTIFNVLSVLPYRRHVPSLCQLTEEEIWAFASILSQLTIKYDNLFQTSFAYSMGIHQRPVPLPKNSMQDDQYPDAHLHLHFSPPLLRSATVRKFLVGFELMAEPQRDLTPEQAAERLRKCSEVHYLNKRNL